MTHTPEQAQQLTRLRRAFRVTKPGLFRHEGAWIRSILERIHNLVRDTGLSIRHTGRLPEGFNAELIRIQGDLGSAKTMRWRNGRMPQCFFIAGDVVRGLERLRKQMS